MMRRCARASGLAAALTLSLTARTSGYSVSYAVTSTSRNYVTRCPGNGESCTVAYGSPEGAQGATADRLYTPTGVTMELKPGSRTAAAYLVADALNQRVQRCPLPYGSDCTTITGTGTIGTGLDQVHNPYKVVPEYAPTTGIVQAYFITEMDNNRVIRCPADGSSCTLAVGRGSGHGNLAEFAGVAGLDLEYDPSDGTLKALIIVDVRGGRVVRCPYAGEIEPCTLIKDQLEWPMHVKIEKDKTTHAPQAYIVGDENFRVLRCELVGGSCANVVGTGNRGNGDTFAEIGWPQGVDIELAEDG